MRKIITPDLGIELTQKCNLNCSHCFRGAARNRNISKEIIEKVFDEIKYIQTLDLSGGEVFLGYEQLKTLLETANQKGTTIESCSMLTNGTIYDGRIYELLDEYFGKNYQVGISDDDFHDKSIKRIETAIQNKKQEQKEKYVKLISKLDALSPLKTLARGYSIIEQNGEMVNSVKQLKSGTEIDIKLVDGNSKAKII